MNTILKNAALAAALVLGATSVTADNFGFQTQVDDDGAIMINLIRATEPGVVVYDFTGGEIGDQLGMADVNAGANADVRVNLDNSTAKQVVAIVYAGEATTPDMGVAMMEFDVEAD